ncbi:DUF6087 family protein [Streptomyces nanshensis]|uniref:DUF6087 family protein n=1 Tax=Streptomyces nanshensis TaxID=518642 RepID=UPI00114D2967|nr:DUF6087 family protein [Streptomyces nanshensis]
MDESLEYLARVQQLRRERLTGKRRMLLLDSGAPAGSHVRPDEWRVIEEFDGYEWRAVGLAPNYPSAAAYVHRQHPQA